MFRRVAHDAIDIDGEWPVALQPHLDPILWTEFYLSLTVKSNDTLAGRERDRSVGVKLGNLVDAHGRD